MRQLFIFELTADKNGYPLRSAELIGEVLTTPYTPFQVNRYCTRSRGTGAWPIRCRVFMGGVLNEK